MNQQGHAGPPSKPRLVKKADYRTAYHHLHFHRKGHPPGEYPSPRQMLGEPLVELHMTDDEAILLASQGITIQGEWL